MDKEAEAHDDQNRKYSLSLYKLGSLQYIKSIIMLTFFFGFFAQFARLVSGVNMKSECGWHSLS